MTHATLFSFFSLSLSLCQSSRCSSSMSPCFFIRMSSVRPSVCLSVGFRVKLRQEERATSRRRRRSLDVPWLPPQNDHVKRSNDGDGDDDDDSQPPRPLADLNRPLSVQYRPARRMRTRRRASSGHSGAAERATSAGTQRDELRVSDGATMDQLTCDMQHFLPHLAARF